MAGPGESYATELTRRQTLELRARVAELPPLCAAFFRAIEDRTQVRTRLAYALDLRVFFTWLAAGSVADVRALTIDHLRQVATSDLEAFQSYLSLYETERGDAAPLLRENAATGKERKLSSVRALFKYLYKSQQLEENVASLVELPTKHEHEIVRLEPDEVARLLDDAESGEALSPRQRAYHKITRTRDVALLTLLLGTGIRVSECVGLNLQDVDLTQAAMVVTRKGGDRVMLYLSEEVIAAMRSWLTERRTIQALPGHTSALFLSLQNRRITTLSVQNLVKKYARSAAPLKRITPHKLRSTFGTTLYQQTNDIYLVADVLGHADVNTTRKHYADMVDEHRRIAARVVKLRDERPAPEDSPSK